MKRPVAPCKDCQDRFLGCHTLCDKYIKFTHAMKLFRDEAYRNREENRVLNEIETRRVMIALKGGFHKRRKK